MAWSSHCYGDNSPIHFFLPVRGRKYKREPSDAIPIIAVGIGSTEDQRRKCMIIAADNIPAIIELHPDWTTNLNQRKCIH